MADLGISGLLVPEVTRGTGLHVNKRVWLRRHSAT
jgi:hypothetical protein